MIALVILIVACAFVFGSIGSLLNLDSRDISTLMTWGSTIVICSLLIYLGFN